MSFVSIGSSVLQPELACLPGRRYLSLSFKNPHDGGGESAKTFLIVLHVSGTVVVRIDMAVATEGLAPGNTEEGYKEETGLLFSPPSFSWEGGHYPTAGVPVAEGGFQRAPSA